MKVVLRKDVPKVGEADNLAEVSDGYARNYLFPRRLAVPATPAELAAHAKRAAQREKELEVKRQEFEQQAKKLSSLELSITADAGEGGRLFGSVTSADIAAEVQKAADLDVDKRKIELADPIKALGEYTVPIKLFRDITASLKLKIVAR